MLRLEDLSEHFESLPRDFAILSDGKEFMFNHYLLAFFSRTIAALGDANSYQLQVRVPSDCIDAISSFVHGRTVSFTDPFSALLVASELQFASLRAHLDPAVYDSLTEFNFEGLFSKASDSQDCSRPLARFLGSHPEFFARFSESHSFAPVMARVLLEEAPFLFPSEDAKLEFILHEAENWSDMNFEALQCIDCTCLSPESLERLMHYPKLEETNIRSCVRGFGLLKRQFEVRSAAQADRDAVRTKLDEAIETHEKLSKTRIESAKTNDDLAANIALYEFVFSESQGRCRAFVTQVDKMIELLESVREKNEDFKTLFSCVQSLLETAKSLESASANFAGQPLVTGLFFPGSAKGALNKAIEFKAALGRLESQILPALFENKKMNALSEALSKFLNTFKMNIFPI